MTTVCEDILRRIEPVLSSGLTEEQRRWALDVYRDEVLPQRLGDFVTEGALRERLVDAVATDLELRLGAATGAEKWPAVVGIRTLTVLDVLSQRALALAEGVYRDPKTRSDVTPEASRLRERALSLRKELEDEAPAFAGQAEELMSEMLADVDYVVEGNPLTSLRLSRLAPPDTSRAQAARNIAAAYVRAAFGPRSLAAGLPIPVPGPEGLALATMFYAPSPAGPCQPELAVAVHLASLEVLEYVVWRGPADEPVVPWRTPAAEELSDSAYDAAMAEILELTEPVAILCASPDEVVQANREVVTRYVELFRLLVPEGLMPFYHRLSSRFMAWMESAS